MKSREQRRTEAEERATERAQRTIEQQLAALDKRPGNSSRERARLTKKAD